MLQKRKTCLILGVLLILGLAGFFFGIAPYLSLATIKSHRQLLINYVHQHFILSSFVYILVYFTVAALSIPIAIYVAFMGGILFSQPYCTIYVVLAGTLGGSVIFYLVQTTFGEFIKKRAHGHVEQFREGFQKDAISYLLFLRFVPVFPFWLVNIVPALLGVSFKAFFWTSLLGLIPASYVFTQFGRGLGSVFDFQEDDISLSHLMTADLQIAFAALAVLALLPIVIRVLLGRYSKKKNQSNL